jgi:hypothetical protein
MQQQNRTTPRPRESRTPPTKQVVSFWTVTAKVLHDEGIAACQVCGSIVIDSERGHAKHTRWHDSLNGLDQRA